MISWKKIELFTTKAYFQQTCHQFFTTSLLIFRFFLSFFNFNWFSVMLLATILFQVAILLFQNSLQTKFKENYMIIYILSILIHIGTICLNPNMDWQFFHGMELIIVINMNFKKIRNEFARCIILIINLVVFLLKFKHSQFSDDYGELCFFFYCLIIFEFSLKFNKDSRLTKQMKLKTKKKIKKKETNDNLEDNKFDLILANSAMKETKDLDLIKDSFEKDVLNSLGLGLIVINEKLEIIYSNEILFELSKSKNLDEAKNSFLAIQENLDIKNSDFWKIPESDIQKIFKQTMHIQDTLENIMMDEISESSCFKKNSLNESHESIVITAKKEKTDLFVSKQDVDIQFKHWNKKELGVHLKQVPHNLKKNSNDLQKTNPHPQSVLNYIEQIFEYSKQEMRNSRKDQNLMSDIDKNKYMMYADCKMSDEKCLKILISFILLEKNLNSNSNGEILITIRKLSQLEEKFFEEGKTKHKVLGSFCHELRTPINGLINMLDLMQSYKEEFNFSDEHFDQNFTELLTSAVISSHLLLNEIDDFIDYFSYHNEILEIHPGPFDLQESFQDIYRIFSYISQKKNINLIIEIDESIPNIIYNDHQKLRQIIFNLLNNAIRFTSSGFIKISATLKKNNYVQISILDTGSGIKSDDMEPLGQISPTAPNDQKSTCGLGLFICNILCFLIEGDDTQTKKKGLIVYSQAEMGSCFTFQLKCDIASRNNAYFQNIRSIQSPLENNNFSFSSISNRSKKMIMISSKQKSSNTLSVRTNEINNNNKISIQSMLRPKSIQSFEEISSSSIDSKNSKIQRKNLETKILKRDSNNSFMKNPTKEFQAISMESSMLAYFDCNCVKILIVDDVPFNIDVCSRLLNKMKLLSDFASNGLDAVEKIDKLCFMSQQFRDKIFCVKCKFYKMILMDIDMPIKNGIEATFEILNLLKNTMFSVSIIGLSAFDQEDIKRKGLEAGMKDYVSKPITFSKMKELVSKYVLH